MNYKIWRASNKTKYLNIEITFTNIQKRQQRVNLPAWRPGRYEIQNFAKYLRNISSVDIDGNDLKIKKASKDSWIVSTEGLSEFKIKYQFYADIQNAGGSHIEQQFLYLNPINCCMYIEEIQHEPCSLEINFEYNTDVACGLPFTKKGTQTIFQADSYHDLVDSPVMISSKIQHKTYVCQNHNFHIWVKGKIEIPWDKVLRDFKKFTEEQINIFGEFPEDEYHFMLWMMPKPFYHGVEHKNSTMMTLGPDSQDFNNIYSDLLGLASHELFHTWNVKRIRPKELMPYDYSKENYFQTCFVAEGLTTFYGDWILYRCGVLTEEEYIKELETTFKRHFDVASSSTQSLLESSYDLWLDGYQKGIPDRKVSVYHKGAIAALILHFEFQKTTNGSKGLDDLLRTLWINHGKPFLGYSYLDYQKLCREISDSRLTKYFKDVIEGNKSLEKELNSALGILGFTLTRDKNNFIKVLKKA